MNIIRYYIKKNKYLLFMSFDIIIPTTNKDLSTLEDCIEGCKKYIKNYRNIIVISDKKYTNNALWFNENNYQFSIDDLKNIINDHWRFGWYYQQLLKLYVFFTIPNILDNVLRNPLFYEL